MQISCISSRAPTLPFKFSFLPWEVCEIVVTFIRSNSYSNRKKWLYTKFFLFLLPQLSFLSFWLLARTLRVFHSWLSLFFILTNPSCLIQKPMRVLHFRTHSTCTLVITSAVLMEKSWTATLVANAARHPSSTRVLMLLSCIRVYLIYLI